MNRKQILGNMLMLYLAVLAPMKANAQTATLKSGTRVELESIETVYARKVDVGDRIRFKVTSDVRRGDDVLIPRGSIADGIVTEAKKSSIAGTKGRLSINVRSLTLEDGTNVPLLGEVRISGKNRTPASVISAIFVWPCIFFVTGTKAVMPTGYNVDATVLSNTEVPVSK